MRSCPGACNDVPGWNIIGSTFTDFGSANTYFESAYTDFDSVSIYFESISADFGSTYIKIIYMICKRDFT